MNNKGFPPAKRTIDGVVFTAATRARVLGQAEKTAESYKHKGWLARIIPYKVRRNGAQWYAVYVRKMDR